jgi:hypothetical protein
MRPCLLLLLSALVATPLRADVIADTNITLSPDAVVADYRLTIHQDTFGDVTSIWLDVVGSALVFVAMNLDQGSDWYLTEFGDPFSAETIAAGDFVQWTVGGSLDVGVGTFYLGGNTGQGDDPRNVFGWGLFELTPAGTLELLDNAVAYEHLGIIVGTETAIVPGPTGTLVIVAFCVRPRRRRRGPVLAQP